MARRRTEGPPPAPASRWRRAIVVSALAAGALAALVFWMRGRAPRTDAEVQARLERLSPARAGLNVVVVTHRAREGNVRHALSQIGRLSVVVEAPALIRMAE